MKTVTTIPDLRVARAALPEPVGLVPTMGYLHEGHISLARRARQECASLVASIFVNPTQFAPSEDLDSYPRDLDHDSRLLEEAGVDLLWTPNPEVMYPPGFQTWVEVESLTKVLEGASRPTHFQGVTTVVAKLFNVVQPQKAFFGQKDAQQAVVIQRMVADLNFPIEIVVCPIVREPDGLALSSRNTYLDANQRQAATVLYHSLTVANAAFQAGERDADALRSLVTETVKAEALADLEYISCAHPVTLLELSGSIDRALFSMAVRVGKTRLIDNMIVGK
jgi:pantoate--beta-alanine ligase